MGWPVVLRKWPVAAGMVAWVGVAAWLTANGRWERELISWVTGKSHKLQALVHGSWWWGGVAILAVTGLVALWHGWRPLRAPVAALPARSPVPKSRWLGTGLVVLCVLGGVIRWPRMGQSLYNDEAYAFRRHFAGQWSPPDKGEKPVFKPLGWMDACYDNRMGNNSTLYSFFAHLSDTTWRNSGGVREGSVNETAVRLPALAAGLTGIVAIACLGRRIHGNGLGLLLAALATVHPLHIRYSTEARPHGLLLLLIPLFFLALDDALRQSRWRPWLIFGLLQTAVLTAFFGTLWLMLFTNVLLLLEPAVRSPGPGGRWQAARDRIRGMAAAGLAAVLTGLAVAMPQFFQTFRILKDPEFLRGRLDWTWAADAGSMLLLGMRGPALDPGNAGALSWTGVVQGHPVAASVALTMFLALLPAGAVALIRKDGVGRLACAATVPALGTAIAIALASGITLLPWYTLFALPAVLLLLAAGVVGIAGTLRREWAIAVGVIFAVAVTGTWGRAAVHYAGTPREPTRETADFLGRFAEKIGTKREPIKAALWSDSPIYDPRIVGIRSLGQLKGLVETAFIAGRGVILDTGLTDAMPDPDGIMRYLEGETDFELVAILRGNDHRMHTHQVWYARPGPAPAGRKRPRQVQKVRSGRRIAGRFTGPGAESARPPRPRSA